MNAISAWRKDGARRRRNDYPATCIVCGTTLDPGQGAVERSNGRWTVACIAT